MLSNFYFGIVTYCDPVQSRFSTTMFVVSSPHAHQKRASYYEGRLTRLERNTIIVIDDHRVQDGDRVTAVHVPAVGVGRLVRRVGYGVDVYVVVDDVLALIEQVMPFRAVNHVDIFDQDILRLEYGKRDGAEERRIGCAVVSESAFSQ